MILLGSNESDTRSASSTSPAAPVSPDLARLDELHASGTLTDEEYAAAKARFKG